MNNFDKKMHSLSLQFNKLIRLAKEISNYKKKIKNYLKISIL
jgi:hypothetical protein